MPITKALPIQLSKRQETLLQRIVRGTTNSYRLVRRAKLILAAASGGSNSSISRRLELDREQVRVWRERWRESTSKLTTAEEEQVTDKKLMALIEQILGDRPRPGTTKSFTVEQVVQIVAIACESPSKSERPVSHWTARELASEAVKRGIVEKISPRSVGRFLKRSHTTTTSPSLLVKS
ncbi:helix-turn-helix domain-containing protein [Pleurocapsa sp. PCC 7319]|uniref:helix-turn-helix domain-containing protein n=1 Tax=Pleurocapsa sp. PCC 7319 TaxID=118161 RepID=UPI00034D5C70|nr:helix-turn-helix domain-containing protein [Pleurocapsa sp. PCC 7319]